jgi:hypothetical protein
LKAYLFKLTDRHVANYFRRLAAWRSFLNQFNLAKGDVGNRPFPLLEEGEQAPDTKSNRKPSTRNKKTMAAQEMVSELKEKQDSSYKVIVDRIDYATAGAWMRVHLLSTITDFLLELPPVARKVAVSVWLGDIELDPRYDLPDHVLRRILVGNCGKLVRFLYNWQELEPYRAPSGRETAARFGLREDEVTRWKKRIETGIKELLQQRWHETMPGAEKDSA